MLAALGLLSVLWAGLWAGLLLLSRGMYLAMNTL